MSIDSSFRVPPRDSIIYTMLRCNEGFKKTKSAREIVNSIPLRWCWVFQGTNELNRIAGLSHGASVLFDFDSRQHRWWRSQAHFCHWHNKIWTLKDPMVSRSSPRPPHPLPLLLVIEKTTLFHTCNFQKSFLEREREKADVEKDEGPCIQIGVFFLGGRTWRL